MAAGMQFFAADQLATGNGLAKDEVSVLLDTAQTEALPIMVLDEEKSQKAAQILQERSLASNPIRNTMKLIRCKDEDEPGEQKHLKDTGDDGHPIVKLLKESMPICQWFPKLDRQTVKTDIIAGITVGVIVIPQSMSYANIAGLQYIVGMYSACIPTLVYAFFGQSRQLAVGPVAMVSLLMDSGLRGLLTEAECPEWYRLRDAGDADIAQFEVCPNQYAELAFFTSLLVGLLQIAARILRLGFLVSFLGHPVISGFTSGAAIIIGLSQLKDFFGFKIEKSQFVSVTIQSLIENMKDTKPMNLLLGVIWLAALVTAKQVSRRYKKFKILGPLSPLLACALATLLIWQTPALRDDWHVKYVGKILPDDADVLSVSINTWDFSNVERLWPTVLSVTLIGYMESIAIGKNLAGQHGYEIDAGQELLALGMANVVGACFSCYPVTGSFSRSAVNNSVGARTQLSGLVTSLVMLLTLAVLTPLFKYLPKFALAAVVLNSVASLVAYQEAIRLYRMKKNDFALWVIAFLGTLFLGVLLGIFLAVLISLFIVIYESARPQLTILWRIPGTTIYRNVKQESSGTFIPNIFIIRLGASLYFANAAFVKDMILAYVSDIQMVNPTEYIVLEMTSVVSIDSTAVHIIHDIVNDFRSRGVQIAFAMVGNRVEKTLRKAGMYKVIGHHWFFHTVHEAVQYCIRHQHEKKKQRHDKSSDNIVQETSTFAMVVPGNEVGFSNEMHHECTTIYVSLQSDQTGALNEISSVLRENQITIIRAQIEPLLPSGAKHTYLVKSFKHSQEGAKLSDLEIERVREDLDSVIRKLADPLSGVTTPAGQPSFIVPVSPEKVESSTRQENGNGHRNDDHRIQKLEEELVKERGCQSDIRNELREQNRRLDAFMQMQERFMMNGVNGVNAVNGLPAPSIVGARDSPLAETAVSRDAANREQL